MVIVFVFCLFFLLCFLGFFEVAITKNTPKSSKNKQAKIKAPITKTSTPKTEKFGKKKKYNMSYQINVN
jgi:hypothetical protein